MIASRALEDVDERITGWKKCGGGGGDPDFLSEVEEEVWGSKGHGLKTQVDKDVWRGFNDSGAPQYTVEQRESLDI